MIFWTLREQQKLTHAQGHAKEMEEGQPQSIKRCLFERETVIGAKPKRSAPLEPVQETFGVAERASRSPQVRAARDLPPDR